METLNAETSDAVILTARNGLCAQYIHVVQARTALRLHLTTGTMRPIASPVTGWVMLSSMSDLEIAKLVRRGNSEMSSLEELVKIFELLPRLDGIRRKIGSA